MKKEKNENLVLKAKENVDFLQMCGYGGNGCDMYQHSVVKGVIFLASAVLRKHIPIEKFEILGSVELKAGKDVCPCCVSSVEFFEVEDYPGIIHINKLECKNIGWKSLDWVLNNSMPTLRGLHMTE